MDSVFGLMGKDFAIIAADASAGRSILVFQHDQDKIMHLDSHKLFVGAGTPADSVNFMEFISKNLKLYELNNDMKLGTKAAAHFIRGQLARALREGPYQTNLLLAGYDAHDGVSLFQMDYMASLSQTRFGAHGYAAAFCLSVFDREWKPDMTEAEGLDVIRKCIHELKTRFLISQPNFVIKIVDQSGIRVVKL